MDRRKPLSASPTGKQPATRDGDAAQRPASRASGSAVPLQFTPSNSNTRVSTGRPALSKGAQPAAAGRAAPSAKPANSNTRLAPPRTALAQSGPLKSMPRPDDNLGLNSERMRSALVARLRTQGISDEKVLAAVQAIARHKFVDEALASRAYEDAALPIGHGQTISQPWIVARMIAAARNGRELGKVLEVGTGCGYQAAVLAGVAREVYTIERIRALHELARTRLRSFRLPQVRLVFGDGMLGVPTAAPFDAIIVAAAGLKIPDALLTQLDIGGRLVAPEGGARQRLVMIERKGPQSWVRTELEAVRFVPLQPGVLL
jgi:protein-L-isoaspartate(D-aspartate) O-methyltransferase